MRRPSQDFNEPAEADWTSESFATDRGALEDSLGTELSNAFDDDRPATPLEYVERPEGAGLSATSWSGSSGAGVGEGEAPNLEAYAAAQIGLKDHLEGQLTLATRDPIERLIGQVLIDSVDDAGYYAGSLAETAARLQIPIERVERVLTLIQTFDPSGVGARDLAECLAIQLRERDRFDPAMKALVANLASAGETRFRRSAQNLQCRRRGHRRHAGRDPAARP